MNTERVLRRLGATFCAPALTPDQSLDPPLLGLARVVLASAHSPVRPLPVGVATFLRCAGSTRCTSCSALVDSHHLDGLLRSGVPDILQPGADKVRCVSRHRLLRACFVTRRSRSSTLACMCRSPQTRFIPFEAFPSPIAVPHHCGRCPPAVVVPHSRDGCRWTVPKHDQPLWFVTPIPRWLHRRDGVADLSPTRRPSCKPPLCTEMPEATTGFHPKSPSAPPRIRGTSRLTSLLTRPEPGLHVASAEQFATSTRCCQPGALCRSTACSLTPRGDRRIRHRRCRPKPNTDSISVRTEGALRHHRGGAASVVPVAR
jgi:hypothetical protein